MFKDLNVDLNDLKAHASNLIAGAEVTTVSAGGVKSLNILTPSGLLFDLRVTNVSAEVYLNLCIEGYESLESLLTEIGLGFTFKLIKELRDVFKSLPKSLIISKAIPSGITYLILEPTNTFPPVKGVLRGGEIAVTAPSCSVINGKVECAEAKYLPIVSAVANTLKEFTLT